MQKDKKAMVSQLQVITFSIITLVIIAGIGLVVISNLQKSVATCPTGWNLNNSNGSTLGYTQSIDTCVNDTGDYSNTTDPGQASWGALDYGATQLGSTGLLSWLPAVIALIIGVFFLAYFAGGKKGGKRY